MNAVSVISMVSARGGTPLRSSSILIASAVPGSRTSGADMLTVMPSCSSPFCARSFASALQAAPNTRRPSSSMTPESIATWMNAGGASTPRRGCRQRSSASSDMSPSFVSGTMGWKCRSNSRRVEPAAQVLFERDAAAHGLAHLGREWRGAVASGDARLVAGHLRFVQEGFGVLLDFRIDERVTTAQREEQALAFAHERCRQARIDLGEDARGISHSSTPRSSIANWLVPVRATSVPSGPGNRETTGKLPQQHLHAPRPQATGDERVLIGGHDEHGAGASRVLQIGRERLLEMYAVRELRLLVAQRAFEQLFLRPLGAVAFIGERDLRRHAGSEVFVLARPGTLADRTARGTGRRRTVRRRAPARRASNRCRAGSR